MAWVEMTLALIDLVEGCGCARGGSLRQAAKTRVDGSDLRI